MKRAIATVSLVLLFSVVILSQAAAQQSGAPAAAPSATQAQPEFIRNGNQLAREGKLQEALDAYKPHLEVPADAFAANIATGNTLDLMDKGEEARKHFARAAEIAPTPQGKAQADRATAMSYAFEGNCDKTIEWEQKVLDFYKSQGDLFQQGEVSDEAARVCLDTGDFDQAYKWYQQGHYLGLQESNIKPERVDLWNFRWEHAQARIAARRGKKTDAQSHVAAAKAILDKGTNPQQAQFLPYLVGYVALYTGDYPTALNELQKANQNDPFIQCLLAQTFEKLGMPEKAAGLYKKASTTTAHNPGGAYAHRVTRGKF